MWEKTICFLFTFIFVVVLFAGCCTKSAVGATDLAAAGYREIGKLEQLNKELDRISQSARDELSRATASTDDLGDIIQRVFDIAFGLCDEIDYLRAETRAVTATH